jgi:hypothetical protein
MLKEAADDDQRAELHYWLWKLRATDSDHRSEALRIFEQLNEKTPQHEYKKRIEELTVITQRSEEIDATE